FNDGLTLSPSNYLDLDDVHVHRGKTEVLVGEATSADLACRYTIDHSQFDDEFWMQFDRPAHFLSINNTVFGAGTTDAVRQSGDPEDHPKTAIEFDEGSGNWLDANELVSLDGVTVRGSFHLTTDDAAIKQVSLSHSTFQGDVELVTFDHDATPLAF